MLASASKRVTQNELRFTTNSSAKLAQVDKLFDDEEGSPNEEFVRYQIQLGGIRYKLLIFSTGIVKSAVPVHSCIC